MSVAGSADIMLDERMGVPRKRKRIKCLMFENLFVGVLGP